MRLLYFVHVSMPVYVKLAVSDCLIACEAMSRHCLENT